MNENLPQATDTKTISFETLAKAFLQFLEEFPRPSSVGEWATACGLPTKVLREFQRERFIAWLRLPKAARQPGTQAALAEYLGISEHTLSVWRDSPEVRKGVAGGGVNAMQDLIPKAVEKIDASLDSFDSLPAAQTVLKIGVTEVLKQPAGATVNVQVNNRIDASIAAHRMACGHTMADHGPYEFCPDMPPSSIPEVQPETVASWDCDICEDPKCPGGFTDANHP